MTVREMLAALSVIALTGCSDPADKIIRVNERTTNPTPKVVRVGDLSWSKQGGAWVGKPAVGSGGWVTLADEAGYRAVDEYMKSRPGFR